MKKSYLIGIGIVCALVGMAVVYNYQSAKNATPLSQIFPEDNAPNVEYEYMDSSKSEQQASSAQLPQTTQAVPALQQKQIAQTIAAAPAKQAVSSNTIAPKMESENILNVPFTIQVSSFKEKDKAEKILAQLKQKGFSDAYIKASDLKEKGTWYRIYVGRFDTKPEAESTLTKIKSDYKDSFIISPKK